MCIRLNRHYQNCGHDLQKIVRCALPYYWLRGRVDDVELPPHPAENFDRITRKRDDPPDMEYPEPAAFFGCYDCLDEVNEDYSISCPDCSGQGSVHSEADLVSRIAVKSGSENREAYELMKHNYHRYLVNFLQFWPRNQHYLHLVSMEWRQRSVEAHLQLDTQPQPPNNAIWQDVLREIGPILWAGPDLVLAHLMDKILAESKCRQERSHPAQDRILDWEEKETHLSEHCPPLNNTSCALKKRMAIDAESCLRDWLKMHLIRADAPDYDYDNEGNSEMYEEQLFIDDVQEYQTAMNALRSENIAGPINPGKGPYDILEFVPPLDRGDVTGRMNRLKRDLIAELTRAEIEAPRGDESLLDGRTPYQYDHNEQFADVTLDFIFQLLALDPGLSGDRMVEIGKLFHSLLLEPWYNVYGHEYRNPEDEPPEHEAANLELRTAVIEMDNVAERLDFHQTVPNYVTRWWQRLAYDAVLDFDTINGAHDLSYKLLYTTSMNIWITFYKNWLQILANVELSHTKLTQQQLDGESEKGCPVCGDDYDVSDPYNCAVYYGCPNNHTLCKKCYTSLSLTPNRPYNRLQTDQFCPTCRAEIPYNENLYMNLLADMRFMPMLQTVFPSNTITS